MDVALVVDDTGSMGGAIDNVKAALPTIVTIAQAASGGDLRMGLVTFPNDNVVVNVPFTTDIAAVQTAIRGLVAGGGGPEPESSDESLQYAITGAADPSCSVVTTNGPLGAFRPACVKIAVLITDAHPGECANVFTPGVSDAHAHSVAVAAANAGVLISAIFIPDEDPVSIAEIAAIMQDYATTSGGEFVETQSNGVGTGQGISDIIAKRGGLGFQQCATRNARFWFTHAYYGAAVSTNCANLLDAIKINGSVLDLGFLQLPTTFRDSNNVLDANDALMEALGFYWKSAGRTGENGGTQNRKLGASKLCNQRKQLAVELIAATANVKLLGTDPSGCTYPNGHTVTNFPADLLQQAQQAARGEDPIACQTMMLLLRKFNNSGVTNNLVCDMECSPVATKTLRSISRDPTTQITCPGINENAAQAIAIVRFPFSQSVNLANYTNDFPVSTCGTAGSDAVWKIEPQIGLGNARFTVDTFGSNFDTVLSVWVASAAGQATPFTSVACNDDANYTLQSRLSFTTDGVSTYYIVVSGKNGAVGKAKIHVTSP